MRDAPMAVLITTHGPPSKVMRYFCNFDREGTGAISVLKCLEIARCLKMDQLHMMDALKDMDYAIESDALVDFDTFEQGVMSCRERTNRQLRQREIEILVEMRVRADLFQECRESIPQIYEVFRRLSGDVGPIGVISANEAFLAVYELGMMPREQWQKEEIKQFLVPADSEDHVYAQTELNFEDFLTFLRRASASCNASGKQLWSQAKSPGFSAVAHAAWQECADFQRPAAPRRTDRELCPPRQGRTPSSIIRLTSYVLPFPLLAQLNMLSHSATLEVHARVRVSGSEWPSGHEGAQPTAGGLGSWLRA